MTELELTKKIINGNEIRIFSNAALQAQIDKAVSSLPDNAAGAVVAHGDLNGASLSVVGKVGDNWTVVAAGYRSWQGELNAEAEVRYTW